MSVTLEHVHTNLDIDRLMVSMEKSLTKHSRSQHPHTPFRSQRCYIFRVPHHIRSIDEIAYNPKILSIGSLHRGKDGLQAMEKIKWQHLHSLLLRNEQNSAVHRRNAALMQYLKTIEEREQEVRGQYAEDTSHLSSSEFVEMMVLDECFIIELLISYYLSDPNVNRYCMNLKEQQLYATEWMPILLRIDLLLMENQIPFSVLQSLYDASVIPDFPQSGVTLKMLAVYYLTEGLREDVKVPSKEVHHLLHLLHLSLQPDRTLPAKAEHRPRSMARKCWKMALFIVACGRTSRKEPMRIPTATELRSMGVRFRKKENEMSWCFVDLTFEDGLMKIPRLDIKDITNPKLQNLIALEQAVPELDSYFSSYAWFMDKLIDTPTDVEVLRKKGIIDSNLGSDREVANYFNKLCRGLHRDYTNSYLKEVFDDLNKHYLDIRNHWNAALMQIHFKSPWTTIAVFCAGLILFISAVQTVFTVFPAR